MHEGTWGVVMMEKGVAIDSYIAHIVLMIVDIIKYNAIMRRNG